MPAQLCKERYSAHMRHIKHLPLLLAPVLMASVTFAQTQKRDGQSIDSGQAENAISAARSRYTQTVGTAPSADDTTLAQLHRGEPGRPFPPQRGYPWPTYQRQWMDHGNAGHILVGAAIGFGIGAALGANNSARNGTPVGGGIILGGGLFGFLGGCVGKAVGDLQGIHFASTHRRRTDRPSWHEEDEESELRSHSNNKESDPEPSISERAGSLGEPAQVAATASPSQEMPAVR
jgi:hypothetical protein